MDGNRRMDVIQLWDFASHLSSSIAGNILPTIIRSMFFQSLDFPPDFLIMKILMEEIPLLVYI